MVTTLLKEVDDAATPSVLSRLLSAISGRSLIRNLIVDPAVSVSLLQSVLRVMAHRETHEEIRLDTLLSLSVAKFTWVIRHIRFREISTYDSRGGFENVRS